MIPPQANTSQAIEQHLQGIREATESTVIDYHSRAICNIMLTK